VLTIILAVTAALLAWFGIFYGIPGKHWGWATLGSLAAFLAVVVPISFVIRKKLEKIFTAVQQAILSSQEQLRRKVLTLQSKMQSGPKLQAQIEKEQEDSIREALKILDQVQPLYKWNFLARRQTNTVKGQMLFQIKDFAAAEELLAKAFVLDPMTLAMQMSLMYKNGRLKELEKAFHTGVGRFKDEQGTILYALYSWVLVAENRINDAVAVLAEGKTKCENPILAQNWDHLANGRQRRFSNAGFGDSWYSLHLENMPMPKAKAQVPFGGKVSRSGFR
jgi:tetratricopeptide (TPR) repeat protein